MRLRRHYGRWFSQCGREVSSGIVLPIGKHPDCGCQNGVERSLRKYLRQSPKASLLSGWTCRPIGRRHELNLFSGLWRLSLPSNTTVRLIRILPAKLKLIIQPASPKTHDKSICNSAVRFILFFIFFCFFCKLQNNFPKGNILVLERTIRCSDFFLHAAVPA